MSEAQGWRTPRRSAWANLRSLDREALALSPQGGMIRRYRAVVVLAHGDQTSLPKREALDVALRQIDRTVPGEQLHIT